MRSLSDVQQQIDVRFGTMRGVQRVSADGS